MRRLLKLPTAFLAVVLPGFLALWLPAHPEYWRAWDENRVVAEAATSGCPVEAGPMPAVLQVSRGPGPRWVIDGATVERGPMPADEDQRLFEARLRFAQAYAEARTREAIARGDRFIPVAWPLYGDPYPRRRPAGLAGGGLLGGPRSSLLGGGILGR